MKMFRNITVYVFTFAVYRLTALHQYISSRHVKIDVMINRLLLVVCSQYNCNSALHAKLFNMH